MTQDERWLNMWQTYMDYLHTDKHTPSKYRPEERNLVNWAKHNRKLRNRGKLQESRLEKFGQLCEEAKKYQRINQYAYVSDELSAANCDERRKRETLTEQLSLFTD